MVFSVFAEAARGAFSAADVEAEIKIKQRREKMQQKLAEAKARIKAADENATANAANVKDQGGGGWFSSSKATAKPDYAAAQQQAAAAIAQKKAAEAAAPAAAPVAEAVAAPAPAVAVSEGDAKQGAALFKAKCATCHTATDGGPNKQGPNLWDIIGKKSGSVAGFGYTKANKDSGVMWTNEAMFEFLTNPKAKIKGTSMAFPGFKKEKDRSDVIAYLNTLK